MMQRIFFVLVAVAAAALGSCKRTEDFPDKRARIAILAQQGRFGVDGLLELAADTEGRVRLEATGALGELVKRGIGSGAERVSLFEGFSRLLRDLDWRVRVHAAGVFGNLGEKAWQATVSLADAMNDDDPRVRAAAATALGKVRQHARICVPALVRGLSDDELSVRERAVEALGAFGASAKEALFPLKLLLATGKASEPLIEKAIARIEPDVKRDQVRGPRPGAG